MVEMLREPQSHRDSALPHAIHGYNLLGQSPPLHLGIARLCGTQLSSNAISLHSPSLNSSLFFPSLPLGGGKKTAARA
jgi:hypothetical protein